MTAGVASDVQILASHPNVGSQLVCPPVQLGPLFGRLPFEVFNG